MKIKLQVIIETETPLNPALTQPRALIEQVIELQRVETELTPVVATWSVRQAISWLHFP